jgi:hypothetical protein
MFDASRAYALGLIIERLTRRADAVEDVTIRDVGTLYLVDGPAKDDLIAVAWTGLFDGLLHLAGGWFGVMRTFKGEKLKAKKLGIVSSVLEDFPELLTRHTQPEAVGFMTSRGEGRETVPSPLDLAATQGSRGFTTTSYVEKPLCVPHLHWALGMLGGAHFVRWTRWGRSQDERNRQRIALLPIPAAVTFRSHREIKAVADAGSYPCGVSVQTAAAHYAVLLADALGKYRASEAESSDRYGSLIVQAMFQSRRGAWKVDSGSVFPLEYPMRLLESSLTTSAEVFDLWDHLFRWGSVRGNEMLAITLAKFLGQPSMKTFERHARIHLRMSIANGSRRPFPPYQDEWMKEVLHYV